ncbi:cytochrome c oxidase subunit 3 family protein [Acidovorax sp. DW039]|uniref:cytochrome c oxidase subunit 3 family protein n=1 Tax=Acidovorax sp. DW039 TaxID=3095606 RepID=UPI00309141C7|nr:cytochrome c oxidase subunit 3 family protein [Acidovorax sp. DW039]
MSPSASASFPSPRPPATRLRGDLGVWLIILAELLTFGILFVAFAFARVREVALFNAGQATLDLHSGALNTVLLITGSWCVARAVHGVRVGRRRTGARWLLVALLCGCGFVVVKLAEYAGKLSEGIDLTSNTFYTLYLMLTAFHFLHVVVAMLALAYLWLRLRAGAYGPHDMHAMETGAAFWHMVDLLWIVLFPLVYVVH